MIEQNNAKSDIRLKQELKLARKNSWWLVSRIYLGIAATIGVFSLIFGIYFFFGAIILSALLLSPIAAFILIAGRSEAEINYTSTLEPSFSESWQKFAQLNGWSYVEENFKFPQQSTIFHCGIRKRQTNIISGTRDAYFVRASNYRFMTGRRSLKAHPMTIVEMTLPIKLPHLYLHYRGQLFSPDLSLIYKNIVIVSTEFSKYYTLWCPREYEIEALEIFPPDVVSKLMEMSFFCDLEICNNEMLIYIAESISGEEIEQKINLAINTFKIIVPVLDKLHFTNVGDFPFELKNDFLGEFISKN